MPVEEHSDLYMTLVDLDIGQGELNVERRAEKTANVPEQESSALFCVTVKAGASATMECKLCYKYGHM